MSLRLSILCGGALALGALAAGAAYVVASPRVITAVLERRLTGCATATPTCAPHGVFLHKRTLASPADRLVVNPNADTLYSSAWLDLRDGPWILRTPNMGERYFSFQIMDGWTEVAGYVSRRTGDAAGGEYLIAGPGWIGLPPSGMKVFRATTDTVWLLARTLVQDETDLPAVTALQDLFVLRRFDEKQPYGK